METTHRLAAVAADAGGAGSFPANVIATVNKTAIGNDNSFGPQYGSAFDFTLLFNDAILTIVPTALLITACPFYIYAKRQDAVKVERGGVFWAKLVCFLFTYSPLFHMTNSESLGSCIYSLCYSGSSAWSLDLISICLG